MNWPANLHSIMDPVIYASVIGLGILCLYISLIYYGREPFGKWLAGNVLCGLVFVTMGVFFPVLFEGFSLMDILTFQKFSSDGSGLFLGGAYGLFLAAIIGSGLRAIRGNDKPIIRTPQIPESVLRELQISSPMRLGWISIGLQLLAAAAIFALALLIGVD